ncbi:MAG: TIGR04013 family B12-binding domain/radical SAM domain-containing protein, partial [Polyangia bacterium]|nr:TIGR04013 family B12-binding domain/radical SAM domain-containing protein [Polyangia bacterium]
MSWPAKETQSGRGPCSGPGWPSGTSRRPLLVQLRLTRHNRYSIAAVLAVVEETLGRGEAELRLVTDAAAQSGLIEGRGLLLHSFMTTHAQRVGREVGALREEHGDGLLLVAGGPHATGDPEGALGMGFHYAVQGEAAGAGFRAFLRSVAEGEPAAPGVLHAGRRRGLDGQRPWPEALSLFCPIELTRGCPIGCAYCQIPVLHGRRPRHRSLEAIERLVIRAVETGHTFTRFVSSNALAWGSTDGLTPDRRRLEALFVMLRRRGFQKVFFGNFPSEVRPESVTEDLLGLLRDHVDNRGLVVGLQSGSDAMLSRIRRGHSVAQGLEAAARMAAAGFVPAVD